jgi:Tfp pilus assembly protein PilF/chromosome segregation ATPase
MRWIVSLAFLCFLTGAALGAGSDEQYLDIYNEVLLGDSLLQGGHPESAAPRYIQAQTELQKLQADHPSWNPDIVKFRLDYLAGKIQELQKYLPSTNAEPAAVPAPAAPVATPAAPLSEVAALKQQNAGYQEQVRVLTASNAELSDKLKEALSVQPAAVSPDELAKAQAKIVILQKERDLLAVALEHEKTSHTAAVKEVATQDKSRAGAELKKAKDELEIAKADAAASEKKLAEASHELESLKARYALESGQQAAAKAQAEAELKKAQEEAAQLREAGAKDARIIADANHELELLRAAHPTVIQPSENQPPEKPKQVAGESDQLKHLVAEVAKDESEITRLNQAVTAAGQKLADANSQLDTLKTAHPASATDETKALVVERDRLKEELAQRTEDLADAESHRNGELPTVRAALKQSEQRRDELAKKLADLEHYVKETSTPGDPHLLARQVKQLQARVEALEAERVPYTADELALLKNGAAAPLAAKGAPAANSNAVSAASTASNTNMVKRVHSARDLPPESAAVWGEALRASRNGDFHTAEAKFAQVLQQDPSNVYVLAFLANAQFSAGQLTDCEKTVKTALTIDPEDPGCLYLLGLLRYRQNQLDEALDALSLSAKINPTNAATENFLGCVLADKGLRPAAESALRKALRDDPNYADAHFNLAVVYAGNKPPSLELARWHYQRSLSLGHAKSQSLDKLLGK